MYPTLLLSWKLVWLILPDVCMRPICNIFSLLCISINLRISWFIFLLYESSTLLLLLVQSHESPCLLVCLYASVNSIVWLFTYSTYTDNNTHTHALNDIVTSICWGSRLEQVGDHSVILDHKMTTSFPVPRLYLKGEFRLSSYCHPLTAAGLQPWWWRNDTQSQELLFVFQIQS